MTACMIQLWLQFDAVLRELVQRRSEDADALA
jgi:hypothetical protein